MKHKSIDLKAEIDRASLPQGLHGFMFPVFEAISNALHSIEDRFENNTKELGKIRVDLNFSNGFLSVSDNGEGLNERNLDAFLTPLTGNKIHRNGKGFGRFISFKVFENVKYFDRTIETGSQTDRAFSYFPLSLDDNLVALDGEDTDLVHPFDSGLTVVFSHPRDEFRHYFESDADGTAQAIDFDVWLMTILDHFLVDFAQDRVPNDFVVSIDGTEFDLEEFFSKSLKVKHSGTIQILVGETLQSFDIRYLTVDATKLKRHSLYFYSDSRAASDLENLSKGLKENAFNGEKNSYNYLVAVSSDYFISSQSRDKIVNLGVKVETDSGSKPLKDVLIGLVKAEILNLEPEYTAMRRSTIRKNVEEIIALDPMLRRGLNGKTIEDFVAERGILETKEQLASDLFVQRTRNRFDFRRIKTSSFEELKDIAAKKIPDSAKEALAVYVAYRNEVITLLNEMLHKSSEGLAREEAVHELIYPRYRDSEEIDYSAHNLWLIDDDLAFSQYISSDRTVNGSARGAGMYAHDLLVNNQNELLLVEMKRPQKTSYSADEEALRPTDNPVQQLINQVGQIRDSGRVTTSTGREVSIPADKMVRGYILADWNQKLKSYLADNDFIITDSGGPLAYRYYGTRNLMIEVLAFDRLADRASKRNQVFKQILEGRSDYTGRDVNVISASSEMRN